MDNVAICNPGREVNSVIMVIRKQRLVVLLLLSHCRLLLVLLLSDLKGGHVALVQFGSQSGGEKL